MVSKLRHSQGCKAAPEVSVLGHWKQRHVTARGGKPRKGKSDPRKSGESTSNVYHIVPDGADGSLHLLGIKSLGEFRISGISILS